MVSKTAITNHLLQKGERFETFLLVSRNFSLRFKMKAPNFFTQQRVLRICNVEKKLG